MEWNRHIPTAPKKVFTDKEIIQAIKDSIFIATGVEFSFYDTKSRKRNLVILRFAFFKLARDFTNYTYYEIGDFFSNTFHHSTIIHGCETIDDIEYMGDKDERFKTLELINKTFKGIIK
jgi:chromosomal replication initiation ATPase DnaA